MVSASTLLSEDLALVRLSLSLRIGCAAVVIVNTSNRGRWSLKMSMLEDAAAYDWYECMYSRIALKKRETSSFCTDRLWYRRMARKSDEENQAPIDWVI